MPRPSFPLPTPCWLRRLFPLLLLCLLVLPPSSLSRSTAVPVSQWREGDIVLQASSSAQSEAIRLATGSPWTHCGLVLKRNGRLMVFEASRRVRYTSPEAWAARSVGKRLLVLRLRDAASVLTPARLRALRKAAARFEGKPYDLFFEWTDDAQYCSELVWKIYKNGAGITLSPLRNMRDYDFSHPAVRAAMRQRYGTDIPRDQPVVAPSDLAASARLAPVRATPGP